MADAKSLFEIIISAVDETSDVFEKIEHHINRTTAPLRELHEHLGHLGEHAGLEKIGEGFANLGEHIAHAGEMLGEFLGPLAALGAAGSVAGLAELALKVSENGERIHDAAIKIGGDAESLQKLDFGAKLNSVPVETMEMALTKLNRVLGDSAAGKNKDAAQMFAHLGIAIRDASGHVLSATQIMPKLADSIEHIENPAIRTRIAVTAFSRAGAALIPMLAKGSEGLRDWGEEAEKAGILTNEQVDSAKEFADKYAVLKASVEGLTNAVGAQLLPVLQPLVEEVTEWVQANRQLISVKVEGFVERLVHAVEKIDFERVAEEGEKFLGFLGRAVDAIGGAENAMILGAAVMAGPFLSAIAGIGAALVNLGLVIASTPIGLIAIGIAAAAAAGYELYQHWSAIFDWWHEKWAGFSAPVKAAIQGAVDGFSPLAGALLRLSSIDLGLTWDRIETGVLGLPAAFRDAAKGVWDGMAAMNDSANDFQARIAAATARFWSALPEVTATAWSQSVSAASAGWAAISGALEGAASGAGGFAGRLWSDFPGATATAWRETADALSVGWAAISGALEDAASGAGGFAARLWSDLPGATVTAWSQSVSAASAGWAAISGALDAASARVSGFAGGLWSGLAGATETAWSAISAALKSAWDGIVGLFESAWSRIEPILKKITDNPIGRLVESAISVSAPALSIAAGLTGQPAAAGASGIFDQTAPPPRAIFDGAGAGQQSPPPQQSQTQVIVDFRNAPPGLRVNTVSQGPTQTETNVGYAMRQE